MTSPRQHGNVHRTVTFAIDGAPSMPASADHHHRHFTPTTVEVTDTVLPATAPTSGGDRATSRRVKVSGPLHLISGRRPANRGQTTGSAWWTTRAALYGDVGTLESMPDWLRQLVAEHVPQEPADTEEAVAALRRTLTAYTAVFDPNDYSTAEIMAAAELADAAEVLLKVMGR